jgi:phosphatidylserine synthase
MAAGLIVSIVLLNLKFNVIAPSYLGYLFLFLVPVVGLLMVSNTIFIKRLAFKGINRFNFLIIISIVSLALITNIELGSFIFFYFYLFFSLFKYFLFKLKKKSGETSQSF